jgi:hypothetical protein
LIILIILGEEFELWSKVDITRKWIQIFSREVESEWTSIQITKNSTSILAHCFNGRGFVTSWQE